MTDWIDIDGSQGEGGGQVLRTSLSLSMVTGRAFRIRNIRAGRSKPGLLRQHLTAVNAAAQIGQARVKGNELGSREVTFAPGEVTPGDFTFSIGSAGSTTLVLQTLLPALLTAHGPSRLVLEGGTHNPSAPTFDFLEQSFLPLLARMGPRVEARLERPGFYPAGGGRVELTIEPVETIAPITLLKRGKITRRHATIWLANLTGKIIQRQKQILKRALSLEDDEFTIRPADDSPGPGNVISVAFGGEAVTEVFTGHGRKGVLAEAVAEEAAHAALAWLKTNVPVGPHLADQLLLPLALAGSGSFRTHSLGSHARTNIDVVQHFMDVPISVDEETEKVCRVTIGTQQRGN